jgi:SAM-dependent methyltransferase
MKLYDLAQLTNDLKTVDTSALTQEFDNIIEQIRSFCGTDEEYNEQLEQAANLFHYLKHELRIPMAQVEYVQDMASQDIEKQTAEFFADDYDSKLIYRVPENIREVRKLQLPIGVDEYVKQAIDLYVDWRHAGLEIGCRDGEWTQYLVGCDPLYITDHHQLFLDSTLSKHTPEYQRRLRPYLIEDDTLSKLPQGQFGFVFSWNFFNYMSLARIKRYLTQVYDLLKPGGTFMFSYNNADMPGAARYADGYFMSYAPKSKLLPMCEEVGFTITSSTDFESAVSWIEIKKPGDLTSIKAHQVLGEIKFVAP